MKHVQLIWAHPRNDSLTSRVAQAVKEELILRGCSVAELDLYRYGFNPVLDLIDEPDWANVDKTYSDEVLKLSAELEGKDAVFIVFPVWWFSTPALLKGYLDRVWNYGIVYGGGRRLPFDSVRWIALAGAGEKTYAARGLDKSMKDLLNIGIAEYCGANDSQVRIFYDILGGEIEDLPTHHAQVIEEARQLASDWVKSRSQC